MDVSVKREGQKEESEIYNVHQLLADDSIVICDGLDGLGGASGGVRSVDTVLVESGVEGDGSDPARVRMSALTLEEAGQRTYILLSAAF